MTRRAFVLFGVWIAAWAVCLAPAAAAGPAQEAAAAPTSPAAAHEALLQRYCLTCHNERLAARGTVPIALSTADLADVSGTADVWEKVIRKLRTGSMPPAGRPRPAAEAGDAFAAWLETENRPCRRNAHPNPGRTEPLHRLNRTEYQNAIRDLLAFDVDAAALVPADDQSYGFDNIAGVLKVSPTLLERYMNAARTISRLAVGASPLAPAGETFRIVSATCPSISTRTACRSGRAGACPSSTTSRATPSTGSSWSCSTCSPAPRSASRTSSSSASTASGSPSST